MSLEDNIQNYIKMRQKAARIFASALKNLLNSSEKQFSDRMLALHQTDPELFTSGWYDPPAGGVFALFGHPPEYHRLRGGSMRMPGSWPRDDLIFNDESVGMIYNSPVHKSSGLIGDYAATVYLGKSKGIQKHFVDCLQLFENIAEAAQVGMEFREYYQEAQQIMNKTDFSILPWPHVRSPEDVNQDLDINFGHTIPWTHAVQTIEEEATIATGNMDVLKNLTSKKRLFASMLETFRIPPTIAFGVDFRIVKRNRPDLPPVYFYPAVIFNNGKKQIISNLDSIFKVTGMDKFIKSKY
jgi:hypothetical protein